MKTKQNKQSTVKKEWIAADCRRKKNNREIEHKSSSAVGLSDIEAGRSFQPLNPISWETAQTDGQGMRCERTREGGKVVSYLEESNDAHTIFYTVFVKQLSVPSVQVNVL